MTDFASRLLRWHASHGRHDLPWQLDRTPYRVWVSEIMLQQTQVATVIPYFLAFMARFPDVQALAAADEDQVLALWSGLGYYARARNLHRAARRVVEEHGGCFPGDIHTLQSLPGIGRSTAGAILALACGQRHPILDGNVKRVLARHYAVAGWPGQAAVATRLWTLSDQCTPRQSVDTYTQAIMDLGATVCGRSRPACDRCPVADTCQARAANRQADFPGAKPRKTLPVRQSRWVVPVCTDGAVLLQRRPPAGLWGGLWCLPELGPGEDAGDWCRDRLGGPALRQRELDGFRHTFSHFHLDVSPVRVDIESKAAPGVAESGQVWYKLGQSSDLGLPAPVQRLLERLEADPDGM